MICPTCSRELAQDLNFCPYCGTKLGMRNASGDSILEEDRHRVRNMPKYNEEPHDRGEGHGRAIASLVVGIIGVVFGGLILGIIAIVLANNSKKLGGEQEAAATAGKVLGIISILKVALIVVLVILIVIGIMGNPAVFSEIMEEADTAITPLLMTMMM